jgi:hypothetical protein
MKNNKNPGFVRKTLKTYLQTNLVLLLYKERI